MSEKFNLGDELVRDLLNNQKRDRRWKNIRFFTILLVICISAFLCYRLTHRSADISAKDEKRNYVSLVRLNGVIYPDSSFSAKTVIPLLEDAFADKNAKGVVLVINSGGGSPVQSSIIEQKILQLKKRYNKKVVVVGEDLLASGAYLVAMGADKIYVNANTITGSIGVIMEGFGFTDLIKTIGITRRVFTAGENKNRLDPFQPETAEDKEKIQKLLEETHQNFIQIVEASRGERLKGDPAELFSGDFWIGITAKKLGIVDEIGNLADVLPQEFNVAHYVDYSEQPSVFEYIMKSLKTELDLSFGYHHSPVLAAM